MVLFEDNKVNMNKIALALDYYYDWLEFNTRSITPLSINLDHLVKAQYHEEIGRGGYFAPESGTSEGQFLTILGYIHMYEATGQLKWLGKAEKLVDGAISFMFGSTKFPGETFNEYNLYTPQWLFNAAEDFTAEAFYTDKTFSFVNGVATINCAYSARKAFKAYSSEYHLLWDDPFATVVDKDNAIAPFYSVASISVTGNTMTVTLSESVTANLICVYSDLGGPTIIGSECYEAYPIWRAMLTGEIASAVDSLIWSYDCWCRLYTITNSERYRLLKFHTENILKFCCAMPSVNAYINVSSNLETIFSDSGSFNDDNREPACTWARSETDGSIEITVPEGAGIFSVGDRFSVDTQLTERYYEVGIRTDIPTDIGMSVQVVDLAGVIIGTYNYWQKTTGGSNVETLQYHLGAFKKTTNCIFDLSYAPHRELIYKSEHSTCVFSTEKVGDYQLARVIDFFVGTEHTESGEAFAGWSQYHPTLNTATFTELPDINYKSSGNIEVRFLDEAGWVWIKALPNHKDYATESLQMSSFYLYEDQKNSITGDVPSAPTGECQTLLFCAASTNAKLHLLRLGSIEDMPIPFGINTVIINMFEETAQTINLYTIRPLPITDYKYAPWVFPFTFNTLGSVLNSWRGCPYVGYQAPWVWANMELQDGVDTSLEFLRDAQMAYYTELQDNKFFKPVFIWNRWDSVKYGEANTFSWDGPDPNTAWGGYQYRALEVTTRVLLMQPANDVAGKIVTDYFLSLDRNWPADVGRPPSTFSRDGSLTTDVNDINGIALILRSAVYALQSGAINEGLCARMINKCIVLLDNLFVWPNTRTEYNTLNTQATWDNNSIWYQFHGGELMSALAELMKVTTNDIYIQGKTKQWKFKAYPKSYIDTTKDYLEIQTPTGIKVIPLVSITDKLASEIYVQTANEIKALKGSEDMSVYDVKTLCQNVGGGSILRELQTPINPLVHSEVGAISIHQITGGVKVTNVSPRATYNYSAGLYNNLFFLQPNTDYTICFTTSGTGSAKLAFMETTSAGNSPSIILNKSLACVNNSMVYYKFKTATNHTFITIYPPGNETTMNCIDIMLFKGSVPNFPKNYIATTSDVAASDVTITVKSTNLKYADIIHLSDYIPSSYLPLRQAADGTSDTLDCNTLIKRVDSDYEVLADPIVYNLTTPLPILGCGKDSWLLVDSDDIAPKIEVEYPSLFSAAYSVCAGTINIYDIYAIVGTFTLGTKTVSGGV